MSDKRFASVLATALIFMLSAGSLSAQTNRGGIAGTVFDSSGATVPRGSLLGSYFGFANLGVLFDFESLIINKRWKNIARMLIIG